MEIIIKIDGMSCNHCTASVKNALCGICGVKNAEVSLEDRCAKVVFDEKMVSAKELKTVIEEQGFDVVD